jgi:hypothetical protein
MKYCERAAKGQSNCPGGSFVQTLQIWCFKPEQNVLREPRKLTACYKPSLYFNFHFVHKLINSYCLGIHGTIEIKGRLKATEIKPLLFFQDPFVMKITVESG